MSRTAILCLPPAGAGPPQPVRTGRIRQQVMSPLRRRRGAPCHCPRRSKTVGIVAQWRDCRGSRKWDSGHPDPADRCGGIPAALSSENPDCQCADFGCGLRVRAPRDLSAPAIPQPMPCTCRHRRSGTATTPPGAPPGTARAPLPVYAGRRSGAIRAVLSRSLRRHAPCGERHHSSAGEARGPRARLGARPIAASTSAL